jgi:predicted unusual protein kinase regulating ubiquinone biosynthesis (AarF/ABC1/UbiB family)
MSIKNRRPASRTMKLLGVGVRTLGRSVLQKLPMGDEIERRARHWEQVGRDWAETLGELRGAAMKMGQFASQYAELLPPALGDQLRRLQRSAEPLPYADIKAVLDQAWTPAQWAQVAQIEPEALAAASIGQVHRARLADGRAVVVKLRYPGVREAVDADLVQLRRLLKTSRLLPVDAAAMDAVMAEVRARVLDETDYRIELEHLHTLARDCAVPGIVYPEPVPELCGESVLVLGEVSGETLETAAGWTSAVRTRLGDTLAAWLCHSFFDGRAVHADPHPGNFAFRTDGSVIVYDMGCVKRVQPQTVDCGRRLLRAAKAHDWPALHAALAELGGVRANADFDELQPVYREFVGLGLDRLLTQERFDCADPAFIDDLRAAGRRHWSSAFKFQPVSELAFVMRALSGHYWMLRTLGAQVPVRALFAQHAGADPALD